MIRLKDHLMLRILAGLLVGLFVFAGCQRATSISDDSEEVSAIVFDQSVTRPGVRWLDFGSLSPQPLAIDREWNRGIVKTNCETVLYDLSTRKRIHTWPYIACAAVFSPTSQHLLLVEHDRASVWDCGTLREVGEIERSSRIGRGFTARPLATFSPDGRFVALAHQVATEHYYRTDSVGIYSLTGAMQSRLPLPENKIATDVCYAGNDRVIVGYQEQRPPTPVIQYGLFDPTNGKRAFEFEPWHAVFVDPLGRAMATANLRRFLQGNPPRGPEQTTITFRDLATGSPLNRIELEHPVDALVFSPSGEHILVPVNQRLVEFSVETGAKTFESDESELRFVNAAYSANGQVRFGITEEPNGVDDDVDHRLTAWDANSNRRLPVQEYYFESYNGSEELAFSASGDRFVDLSAGFAERDVISGKTLKDLPKYPTSKESVEYSPDGSQFLVDQLVTKTATGRQVELGVGHRMGRFVEGGRLVFSQWATGVFLTSPFQRDNPWRLRLRLDGSVSDAAASADARRVILAYTARDDPTQSRLILINTENTDRPRFIHRESTAVDMHPKKSRLLAASRESIRQYEFETANEIGRDWSPPGYVLFARYNPRGDQIVAGGGVPEDSSENRQDSDPGWLMLIDLESGQTHRLSGHDAPVTSAAFSSDGLRLATGSADKTIRLWDTQTYETIHVFRGHRGRVQDVAYCPSGDRLLSAGVDGAAFWDVSGVVDDSTIASPIAESFELGESTNPWRMRAGDLSLSDQRPAKSWELTFIGDVNPRRESMLPWDWLTGAAETKRLRPVKTKSLWPQEPGSEYLAQSRSGRIRAYQNYSKQRIELRDREHRLVSSVAGRCGRNELAICEARGVIAIVKEDRSPDRPRLGEYQITVYGIEDGDSVRSFEPFRAGTFHRMEVDPSGETLTLHLNYQEIRSCDFQSGETLATIQTADRYRGPIFAYTASGTSLATATQWKSQVRIRDPKTLETMRSVETDLPIAWIRPALDEHHVLIGSQYTEPRSILTLLDTRSGQKLWSRVGPATDGGVSSADGRWYLAKSKWNLWTLWDLDVGEIRSVVVGESEWYDFPVFGDDGRSLRQVTSDGELIWSDLSD